MMIAIYHQVILLRDGLVGVLTARKHEGKCKKQQSRKTFHNGSSISRDFEKLSLLVEFLLTDMLIKLSVYHVKFLPDADEGFDRLVEMFLLVCGRKLHADTRLAFGHYRVVETDDVDAIVEHAVGKFL